ncbi:MAG: hypothetical protein H8E17_00545, partial [Deltaproteobacteria bacterium]|nr:hypothetical protein [Deltaproteobacteria bacterium]
MNCRSGNEILIPLINLELYHQFRLVAAKVYAMCKTFNFKMAFNGFAGCFNGIYSYYNIKVKADNRFCIGIAKTMEKVCQDHSPIIVTR